MTVMKKLALIAAGYGISVAAGVGAVALNELFMPEAIKQTSGGMVAFGDMVLLLLVAGILSVVPSFFLLKLLIDKIPRTLLAIELLIALIGPASWLSVMYIGASPRPLNPPGIFAGILGVLIAFAAIPRIILGPVMVIIEAVTFLLARERLARTLLTTAMLMDIVPLSVFALHIAMATR
jgi:hypothetical protein